MPTTGIYQFAQFVGAAPTSKVSVVRQAKHGRYDPRRDYYKLIREKIPAVHKSKDKLKELDTFCDQLNDKRKVGNYSAIINGYKRWLSGRTVSWVNLPNKRWSRVGLAVSMGPELRLVVDGSTHILKIWFKSEPLSQLRSDIVCHLLEATYRPSNSDATIGILDIRNATLAQGAADPEFDLSLLGEAASWVTIYNTL